ncbi:MAG: histidine phosphatase family protein [Anaerolineae bacterium]
MDYYLVCHGHVAEATAVDPYNAPLSPRGAKEADVLAEYCRTWDIQFLCASTTARAQETADIILADRADTLRWDLKELEPLSVDDMEGQVIFSPNPKRWTAVQRRYGLERTWVRLVAALARIEIYASAHSLQRIALVTHKDIINLCLCNWVGLNWTAHEHLDFTIDPGSSCYVHLQSVQARIHWINRI